MSTLNKACASVALCLCCCLPMRSGSVGPLLHTAWAQTYPYNADCPDGMLAGCVAVAMAQVMNYHQYPPHGTGSNTYRWNSVRLTADFAHTWYRWQDMDHLDPSASQLIYHCGVAVWMDYSTSFSGSNEYYAKSALTDFFGYSEDIVLRSRQLYSDEEWGEMLRDDLCHGWPIIYSSGGHTFVVDGYDDQGLFHANMGFGAGGGNRYYTLQQLGSRQNSTALLHIHPPLDDPSQGQASEPGTSGSPRLVVYFKDATSCAIPCADIESLRVAEGTLCIDGTDASLGAYPLSDVSYMTTY